MFCETCARCDVPIGRVRQRHEPDPNIIAIADVLLTQPDEARDEQGRAREQRHRESHLRTYEDSPKTELIRAAAHSPPAFLQTVDQIGTRTLQRGINPHGEAGQARDDHCEREHT